MATSAQKAQFNEEITFLKKKIDEISQKIKYLESRKDEEENILKVRIGAHYTDLVTVYCAMNDVSQSILGFKNESYLDAGRKSLYKALISLENVVSGTIDMPLGDNYDLLVSMDTFTDAERLKLIKKIGYTVQLLQDKYGEKSKWRWSFVEIEGRYATVAKNLFNFRAYQEKNDPDIEGFEDRYDHLYLIKELFNQAARRYREKYELTNHSPEDMRNAIRYLRALKRIHILFNESAEVQNATKMVDLWSAKLENDMKAQEKKLKTKLVNSGKNKR